MKTGNVEHEIILNRFKPRAEFQIALRDAIENKGYKRVYMVIHRRGGKDWGCLDVVQKQIFKNPGDYYYVMPSYSQARKIIWDASDSHGNRVLDYFFPPEIIKSKNSQTLQLRLINGSLFQLIGSKEPDALRGTNPRGVVFSEWQDQPRKVWDAIIEPILRANQGWAIFNMTPAGHNHAYEMFHLAKNNPDKWFTMYQTVDDTQLISPTEIQHDIDRGEISREFALQEYWLSWDLGVEGSYYGKAINRLRQNDQITNVPYDPGYPVWTSWDLGYNDPTCIIFFQKIGPLIRIIDYYEKNKEGHEHYAGVVLSKPYVYAGHIGPHDIRQHEQSNAQTRWQSFKNLGITFKVLERPFSLDDGIEAVRKVLPTCWIDEVKCARLIKCLTNYQQQYDEERKVHRTVPLHSWASHAADAMRYLATGLNFATSGMTQEDADRIRMEGLYGKDQSNLPKIYQDQYNPQRWG